MSGFYGIINVAGQTVAPKQLSLMADILQHRALDGQFVYQSANVGMGYLHTRIFPQSAYERLPLQHQQCVLTGDIRLYNRAELCKQLAISASEQATIPDSFLVIKSYEQWGKSCPTYLNGDFAFVIWDERRQEVFCAKSHTGICPFYYTFINGQFIFANELNAILSITTPPLNEARLKDYYLGIHEGKQHEETVHQNIFRLLSARTLTVTSQGVEVSERYWRLQPSHPIRYKKDEDYLSAFRELLTQSIRCRIPEEYKVGATLSGGLDSSGIVGIAAQELAKEQRTLYGASSVTPPGYQGITQDEKPYLRLMTQQYTNLENEEINTTAYSIFGSVEEATRKIALPLSVNYYVDAALSENLQGRGVRVVLAGVPGDVAVSYKGIQGFDSLLRQGKLITLAAWGTNYLKHYPQSSLRFWLGLVYRQFFSKKAAPPSFAVQQLQKLYRSLFDEAFLPTSVIEAHFNSIENTTPRNTYERMMQPFNADFGIASWEAIECFWAHRGIVQLLPYADIRLLEFLINIPEHLFVYKGWNRGLYRHALQDILPPAICWRTDKGIYANDYIDKLQVELVELQNLVAELNVPTYSFLPNVKELFEHINLQPVRNRKEVTPALSVSLFLTHYALFTYLFTVYQNSLTYERSN